MRRLDVLAEAARLAQDDRAFLIRMARLLRRDTPFHEEGQAGSEP
jgi:hypothetical protein